jgi:hypothetical protein
MIVSPRQAQDKCRESTQKREVCFSQVGHRTASPTPLRDLQVSAISAFFGRGGADPLSTLLCKDDTAVLPRQAQYKWTGKLGPKNTALASFAAF